MAVDGSNQLQVMGLVESRGTCIFEAGQVTEY